MCGLEIRYEEKEILSIKGDKKDPFSRGHICPKAVALKDIYEDPDRLKYPMRKTERGWEQISWEAAYEEIIEKLQAVQQKHGSDAVGSYLGNPNVHNMGSMLFLPTFLKSLKSKKPLQCNFRRPTASSFCGPAAIRSSIYDSDPRYRPHRLYVDHGSQSNGF